MPARLEPRDEGWHEWVDDPPLSLPVHVQLGEHDDGRVHVVALHVEGLLSAEVLRSIPVGRIEALANALLHPHATERGWRADARLPDGLLDEGTWRRSDEFYVAVASIYRHLVSASPRPVAEMAEANDVPRSTAHRWVKEARRRGTSAAGSTGQGGLTATG